MRLGTRRWTASAPCPRVLVASLTRLDFNTVLACNVISDQESEEIARKASQSPRSAWAGPVTRSRRALRARNAQDADAAAGSKQRHVVDRDTCIHASRVARPMLTHISTKEVIQSQGTRRLAL